MSVGRGLKAGLNEPKTFQSYQHLLCFRAPRRRTYIYLVLNNFTPSHRAAGGSLDVLVGASSCNVRYTLVQLLPCVSQVTYKLRPHSLREVRNSSNCLNNHRTSFLVSVVTMTMCWIHVHSYTPRSGCTHERFPGFCLHFVGCWRLLLAGTLPRCMDLPVLRSFRCAMDATVVVYTTVVVCD